MGIMGIRGICISSLVFCFVNTISSNIAPKIINGNDAKEGQFPWQVFVVSIGNGFFRCSGAIISNRWILTSASCVDHSDVTNTRIYSGIYNLNNDAETLSSAESYIVHEEYDNETFQNNIGLLKLKKRLVLDGNTQAITLSEDVLETGTNVTITGWGHSSHDVGENITAILQYASVPIIKNSECAKIYGTDVVDDNIICTRNLDHVVGPCVNDGGGPLVANADTDPVHVGIFSFLGTNGCENNNYPAVYIRTYSYRNWIKEKTGV